MKQYVTQLKAITQSRQSEFDALALNHLAKDWDGTAVLKLQKDNWTEGGITQGVFFSIWITPQDEKRHIAKYNIHALKLRLFEGYNIGANEFADAFRARFAEFDLTWPNISLKYGPQTLFEGWFELDETSFTNHCNALIDNFLTLHHIIDDLFAERELTNS